MPRWNLSEGGYANIEWYSIPTYVATSRDPLRQVYDRLKGGALVGTIRVPDEAKPAQGEDGQLSIIDETHRWVVELAEARRLPNGDLSTAGYWKNDLQGSGLGPGAIAAGVSSLNGVIRKGELVSGTAGLRTGIRHALQAVVPPVALNRNAPGSGPCPGADCRPFVWPADNADTPAYSGEAYETVGNVYMGSLLAIPPWVDINALGIADPQAREVARAAQDYGIYIVDTGGAAPTEIIIRIDPQAAGDIRDRDTFGEGLRLALRHLTVVANSHANGHAPETPGGGGTPRRPLGPSFMEEDALRERCDDLLGFGADPGNLASAASLPPGEPSARQLALPLMAAIVALLPFDRLAGRRRKHN